MNKDIVRQIANVLAVIATIIMNILANALPLNGQNTGDISDRFQVLFVPAGYVFAIWGLIYIGLIAFGDIPGASLPAREPAPAPGGLPVRAELHRQHRLAVLLALQPVRPERGGHAGTAGATDRHLPAPGDRHQACLDRREVGGEHPLQRLPGLDHGGDHRQHHRPAVLHRLERLGALHRKYGRSSCWQRR